MLGASATGISMPSPFRAQAMQETWLTMTVTQILLRHEVQRIEKGAHHARAPVANDSGEVGVEAHAGGQRYRHVGAQAHQRAGYAGACSSGSNQRPSHGILHSAAQTLRHALFLQSHLRHPSPAISFAHRVLHSEAGGSPSRLHSRHWCFRPCLGTRSWGLRCLAPARKVTIVPCSHSAFNSRRLPSQRIWPLTCTPYPERVACCSRELC
jgi:hypothetical protein